MTFSKNRAKRVIKPAVAPLLRRLHLIDERQGSLDARWEDLHHLVLRLNHAVIDVERRQATIEEQIPFVLNSISAQNAMARELRRAGLETNVSATSDVEWTQQVSAIHERLAQVEARGEFIRREVMLELRHGPSRAKRSEARIVRPDRVAELSGHLKVNLGCGHIPLADHLNVDVRELPGVDIVAEVGNLPFDSGTVARIHAAHLLEHFTSDELALRLLPYWLDLLAPGGQFVAVVPDTEAMLAEHSAGSRSFEDLAMVVFGGQEYEGDFHFAMFSRDSLTAALRAAGYDDVAITASGRRNGLCLEMEVVARRPDPR